MRNRVRMALVGINFGRWVMENEILGGRGREFVDVVALADLDQEKAEALSLAWGIQAESSLEAVLRRGDVEAVLLMTGPVGRANLVMQCLDAGKAVMTTKPFDLSADRTLAAMNQALAKGLPIYMNSPYPTLPRELAVIRRWVEEYDLGQAIAYRGSTHCSYREEPDGSWYDDPQRCPAAPLFRLGIYVINDLCRLLPPVREARLVESRIFTKRPTSDNALISLLHEGGAIGSIHCSFCVADGQPYRNSLELNFERGTIYRQVGPVREQERAGIRLQLCHLKGSAVRQEEELVEKPPEGYPWVEFYSALRGNPPPDTVSPQEVACAISAVEKMASLSAGYKQERM